MGCVCSIARQIGADVDIKKSQEIKVNLNNNKIINQNQNQKEDIIIETKIPDTTELSQDKNNKLKNIEEKEINNEKKEESKGEDEKIEKNETGILSKNLFNTLK